MRDMFKTLEVYGELSPAPPGYQLTYWELKALLDLIFHGHYWKAITSAFDYGFILGRRCEAKERKKKTSGACKR